MGEFILQLLTLGFCTLALSDFSVQLLNSNFKLSSGLGQFSMHLAVLRPVTFEPPRHPAKRSRNMVDLYKILREGN